MGLFDAFSFKREAQKVFNKENFHKILLVAREAIVSFAKDNMPGVEKKKRVDEIVSIKIRELVAGISNKLVLWLVNRIIDIIPVITQLIYDFLKEKVENL